MWETLRNVWRVPELRKKETIFGKSKLIGDGRA